MRPLKSEIELLLCCARTRLDPDKIKNIRSLVQREIDWEFLVQSALVHRVMPLLYRSLETTCSRLVPKEYLDKLRICYLNNAGRNLARTTRLLELIETFEDRQITAIPFKGPVLAESAYGDLALRQFADLDILVHRDNVLDAYQLLLSQGYRPEVRVNAEQIKKYSKTEYSLAVTDKDSKVVVELHWEVTGRYTGYSFDLDHLENRLETATISGKKIRQFPAEDLLVYLCIHGSKDSWNNLDSICCVAELIRSRPDMEWNRVEHLAEIIHCRRMLHLGLFLANYLLGAKLPTHILEKIDTDPVIKKKSANIGKTLFSQPDRSNTSRVNSDFSMFHLAIKDRFPDKLRHVLNLIFLPSRQDWRYFSLPVNLSFLYYPLRPVRLAREAGAAWLHKQGVTVASLFIVTD